MENISILSKRYDYVSKIISKWRVANREKIINSIKKYPITKMCKIANVSKSGYYKWQKNKDKISFKEILDYALVKDLFFKGKGVRGIRRIKMDLEDIHGIIMNRKKISRIMKELNLRTKTRKQLHIYVYY